MRVILHIGAHRCATTTFQHYLRANADRLAGQGVGVWLPPRTRRGLFSGIIPAKSSPDPITLAERARGRIRLNLAKSAERGVTTLIVSEENIVGTMGEISRLGQLYPAAGERVARYRDAFGDALTDVVLNLRSQHTFWPSVLAYGLGRGRALPGAALLGRIASAARGWREVAEDVACAAPGVRLHLLPFERYAGRPEAQFAEITGLDGPATHARERRNAGPSREELRAVLPELGEGQDRWQPFAPDQIARLRAAYADDMAWLTAGGTGVAELVRHTRDRAAKPAALEDERMIP